MRIQHNIPAMSSYRNYTNNTSALAKNLEKLSSGYKINRAGDDAAGLAISEKMRAQISGLEQAQSNAKSGINLVQTAEGALTEVHDMLNRMVTLAEQSANGTYDNEVDRVQLQKEVDQLKSEINRIADSANFNGIKLLDGSMDSADKVTVKAPVIAGEKAMVLKDLMNAKPIDNVSTYTQFHKDPTGSSKTSFEVSLDHVSFEPTINDDGTVNTEVAGKLQVWVGKDSAEKPDPSKTGDDAEKGVNVLLLSYKATVGDDGKVSAESIANSIMSGKEGTTGQKLRDDGTVDLTFKVPIKDGAYVEDMTQAGAGTEIKVEYKVTLGDDGKTLKFEMTDKGYATAAKYYKDAMALAETDEDNADALKASADNLFRGNFHIGVHDGANWSEQGVSATTNINPGGVDTGVQPAIATWFMQDAFSTIKDGAGMKLGDQYYVWGMSDETVNANYGDNVKVIDIRDLCKEGKLQKADGSGPYELAEDFKIADNQDPLAKAIDRLSVVAKDNDMWHVQVNRDGNAVIFTEKSTNASDADLTTKKGIESQLQTVDKIMSNVETTKATGKALTLQIGDTAEAFNQMKVNIGDMHAAAMGIGDIDISTQDGAAEAMGKIKDAINYVSDVRGTLGATQNRLDHTINNLSVMQENIQDAESTIRDVDIAAEMMNYTKNSILVQSAQAMLAQANQMPQGVLQLLQ